MNNDEAPVLRSLGPSELDILDRLLNEADDRHISTVRSHARNAGPLYGADAQALEGALSQAERELVNLRERLSISERERVTFRDAYLRIRDQRDDLRRHNQHWFDKWQAAHSAIREIAAGNLDGETAEQFAERARRVAMGVQP